jgi:mannose/cellobiose epimerase-like protein (N-acyl-D-glucosamine 2-epimerase family)
MPKEITLLYHTITSTGVAPSRTFIATFYYSDGSVSLFDGRHWEHKKPVRAPNLFEGTSGS